ncbi:MAG: glycosyltransferase family 2 protein [Anaerolineae bacterium]|nr:glycosyltransferase family 2 protein [Anaerolineae bacterium]
MSLPEAVGVSEETRAGPSRVVQPERPSSMALPLVSLVIPTHRRVEALRRCLEAALQQDYAGYEIIVVDDASGDDTVAMVRDAFPQVRLLVQASNRGPAAARNLGLAHAKGEIIAFTDDDCLIPPDFLSSLVAGYLAHPEVGGVGGYMEAPAPLLARNLLAQYEAHLTHHVYGAGPEPRLGGWDCPVGGTNAMSYRKATLAEVGGFDESFPVAAGEDADLKWRVAQRGGRLLYVPTRVIHCRDYRPGAFWRQQIQRGVGAAHFEFKRQGRYPGPGRIALRIAKRTVGALMAIFQHGLGLAAVQLLAGWADALGQMRAWMRSRGEETGPVKGA